LSLSPSPAWKSKAAVALVLLGVLFLPLAGSLWATGALPRGFGAFPAEFVRTPPGFSLLYFGGFAVFVFVVALFLLVPRWFGFRPAVPEPLPAPAAFPWWFWWSLPVAVVSWLLMWARLPALSPLDEYAYVPLAWAFNGLLDGLVYRRTGGRSLMARNPAQFRLMILVSCLSWFLFEYLNFFVLSNWYYPNSHLLTDFGTIVWFFLGYTTVLTGLFEWYSLLRSLPGLKARYREGPRLRPGRPWLLAALIAGLALSFALGAWPDLLFWGLWVSLVPTLGAALLLARKSTILDGLRRGDWSEVNLLALGTLANGVFWELWNFGSQWFHHDVSTAPGFWMYCIPYVDAFHLFSEMPLLGYAGYLFFGINCGVLWNLSAYFLDFDDRLEGDTEPVAPR